MLIPIILTLFSLYGIDRYLAPEKARWFYLHIWINTFCLISGSPDIFDVLINPNDNFPRPWSSSVPYGVVCAGHIYHMLFFNNLKYMDWLHHITMIFITMPWTVYFMPCKGAVFALAGLSGLPGGIDYVLLTLAKLERISWNTEKYWNNYIQIWLRAPWLIMSCGWGWGAMMKSEINSLCIINFIFVFWNACFFMQDTVRANYVKLNADRRVE
jgi:hypothetical protein